MAVLFVVLFYSYLFSNCCVHAIIMARWFWILFLKINPVLGQLDLHQLHGELLLKSFRYMRVL